MILLGAFNLVRRIRRDQIQLDCVLQSLVNTADNIPRQKAIIEEIMSMVGGTSGNDDDQPPQKKLVLRRR